MSLWTDFRDNVENQAADAIGDPAIVENVANGLLKVVNEGGGGNRNAADIAQGKTGNPGVGLSPAKKAGLALSLPMLIAIGVGIYFLTKKR